MPVMHGIHGSRTNESKINFHFRLGTIRVEGNQKYTHLLTITGGGAKLSGRMLARFRSRSH
jgi:hypothetical protein